jgi:hypothetical protein
VCAAPRHPCPLLRPARSGPALQVLGGDKMAGGNGSPKDAPAVNTPLLRALAKSELSPVLGQRGYRMALTSTWRKEGPNGTPFFVRLHPDPDPAGGGRFSLELFQCNVLPELNARVDPANQLSSSCSLRDLEAFWEKQKVIMRRSFPGYELPEMPERGQPLWAYYLTEEDVREWLSFLTEGGLLIRALAVLEGTAQLEEPDEPLEDKEVEMTSQQPAVPRSPEDLAYVLTTLEHALAFKAQAGSLPPDLREHAAKLLKGARFEIVRIQLAAALTELPPDSPDIEPVQQALRQIAALDLCGALPPVTAPIDLGVVAGGSTCDGCAVDAHGKLDRSLPVNSTKTSGASRQLSSKKWRLPCTFAYLTFGRVLFRTATVSNICGISSSE